MFTLLLVALCTSLLGSAQGSPLVQISENFVALPLVHRHKLNGTGSGHRLLQHDQARAQWLLSHALPNQRRAISEPVNDGIVSYTVQIKLAGSGQPFTLVVDTGSSNTWVGAQPGRNVTGCGQGKVSVKYGSGSFSGVQIQETLLTIGGMKIANQSIGVASHATGFAPDLDGILGLGPRGLTQGTVTGSGPCSSSLNRSAIVPTVVDTAFASGLINTTLIGISFEPTITPDEANGEITFGGVNASRFDAPLTIVPITKASPANQFVGIDQTVSYNGKTILKGAGITDTGTTLLMLADGAFNQYLNMTGAVPDKATSLLKISPLRYANLKSLFFTIGGKKFEFTKSAQTWPRSLNTAIGGDAKSIYLIVASIGTNAPDGLTFINGMTWLQRFYTTYDSSKNQFGVATTGSTFAETN